MSIEVKGQSVADAMKVVIEALKTDPEYYYSWQANIAMAFQDEFHRHGLIDPPSNEELHTIANTAAKEFLDILTCKYCDLAEEVGL